jgi:hypothetical protein
MGRGVVHGKKQCSKQDRFIQLNRCVMQVPETAGHPEGCGKPGPIRLVSTVRICAWRIREPFAHVAAGGTWKTCAFHQDDDPSACGPQDVSCGLFASIRVNGRIGLLRIDTQEMKNQNSCDETWRIEMIEYKIRYGWKESRRMKW